MIVRNGAGEERRRFSLREAHSVHVQTRRSNKGGISTVGANNSGRRIMTLHSALDKETLGIFKLIIWNAIQMRKVGL